MDITESNRLIKSITLHKLNGRSKTVNLMESYFDDVFIKYIYPSVLSLIYLANIISEHAIFVY